MFNVLCLLGSRKPIIPISPELVEKMIKEGATPEVVTYVVSYAKDSSTPYSEAWDLYKSVVAKQQTEQSLPMITSPNVNVIDTLNVPIQYVQPRQYMLPGGVEIIIK